MPTPMSYSLSAAAAPEAAACRTKKRTVSAQLSRLMGSTRSPAEEFSRRRVSEDGMIGNNNNNMSKAAAWMWHTRAIPQAAPHVLPTTSMHCPAVVNGASSCIRSSSRSSSGAINTRDVQPSRFKAEAQNHATHESQGASTPHHSGAAHDEEQRSSKVLYDELELSCLQELLETEIVNKHSKISAQQQHLVAHADPCTYSASTTSSSRQIIKPLSAIHKLFKRLYTTVHNRNNRNSAIETGPASRTESGPRKLGSVQHVVHHHHHHYHYNRSLDLHSAPGAPTHLHGFVTRRRRHSESCSRISEPDHLQVHDSLNYADAHHRGTQRSPALFRINSAANDHERLNL